ncbi:MAG: hypothetical protein WBM61_17255, partial [Woeseiaceae bacterium]
MNPLVPGSSPGGPTTIRQRVRWTRYATVSVRTHRAHGKVVVRVLAGPPLFGSVFVGHGMPLSWYARIA